MTMREVIAGCAGDLVISGGFLEEVTLVWSLPFEVWS